MKWKVITLKNFNIPQKMWISEVKQANANNLIIPSCLSILKRWKDYKRVNKKKQTSPTDFKVKVSFNSIITDCFMLSFLTIKTS